MAVVNLVTLSVPLLTAVAYGLYCLVQHRRKINELRKQGVCMPKEWSWLTGHMLVFQKYADRLPSDANVLLAVHELCKDYSDTDVVLVDVWPADYAQYMVSDPDVAVQIANKHNLPKSALLHKRLLPITGGPSLVAMNGIEWKKWRSVFNPGFSAGSMVDQVSAVVNSVQVYCDILGEKVGSGIVQLDHLTMRLTMDVILQVTLDMTTNYQRVDNELVHALNTINAWHSFWDPRVLSNPIRPIVQRYYSGVLDRCIRKELDKRFAEMQHDERSPQATSKRAKSVIALALEAYMADQQQKTGEANKLDDVFARYAAHQIRLFLFAGNDTTSSSIVYVYHMLSKHPEALAQVRQEHDRIFGPDPSAAAQLLRSNPTLLNQCPYTLAIIHPSIQRNPHIWPSAEEFLPQRFLVEPGHELYPHPAAWRPFEQGPRNCIGQTLVYNEMRIVLVMTARLFDIRPAYDEWDAMQAANEGTLKKLARWAGLGGNQIKTVHGERAYQSEKAGSHPADGYPCRITLAQ
ncbi:cytochrome P450 [Aspergillus undulatus]|uniref:cytochrome P450 n=1 Tax=Aspergillus undulatus TaxID=1810928 RepID=UPI003CCD031B